MPVVSGGLDMGCFIAPDQTVACWGWEGLARGDFTTESPTPAPLAGPAGSRTFSFLFGGPLRGTNCGVSAGDLYCWGNNQRGEAGQTHHC